MLQFAVQTPMSASFLLQSQLVKLLIYRYHAFTPTREPLFFHMVSDYKPTNELHYVNCLET